MKVFLSYRRSDGARVASWLRGRLQSFSLPEELCGTGETKPFAIFLDTSYEKSSEDFWNQKILPNLLGADALIVLLTPAVAEPQADGSKNWVVREIETFLEACPEKPVILAFGPGGSLDRLPEQLARRSSRWDPADLRQYRPLPYLPLSRWQTLDREVTKVVARLLDTPDAELPVLHREEERKRNRLLMRALASAAGVFVTLFALTVWALFERAEARRQTRTAEARLLAAESELIMEGQPERIERAVLLAVQAHRRSPGSPSANRALRGSLGLLPARVAAVTVAGEPDALVVSDTLGLVAAVVRAEGDEVSSEASRVRLWRIADGGAVATLSHDSAVRSAALSPDGLLLATGTSGGVVRVWDLAALPARATHEFRHGEAAVYGLAFDADGEQLFSAGAEGNVVVWNLETGKLEDVYSHPGAVSLIRIGPSGDSLAVGGGLVAGAIDAVVVWESESNERRVFSHDVPLSSKAIDPESRSWADTGESYIQDIAMSPDGTMLVSGGSDGTARVWRLAEAASMLSFQSFGDAVYDVGFSPDGELVAAAGAEGVTRVWEPQSGASHAEFVQEGSIRAIAFSSDGRYLATVGDDRTARVWDLHAQEEHARVGLESLGVAVRFAEQDRVLVTAEQRGNLVAWDLTSVGGVHVVIDDVSAAAMSPDGSRYAAARADGGIEIRSRLDRTDPVRVELACPARELMFGPAGERVAAVGDCEEGSARVWDARNGEPVADLSSGRFTRRTLDISEDGRLVATASGSAGEPGVATIWESATQRAVSEAPHEHRVLEVRFTAEGTFATLATDAVIRLWDRMSGAPLAEITPEGADASFLMEIDVSDSGERIAYVNDKGVLSVYSLPSLKPLRNWNLDKMLHRVALAPDGESVAAAGVDRGFHLCSVSEGECRTAPYASETLALAFSRDGRLLLSGGADNTARVWDVASLQETARYTLSGSVTRASFSAGGDDLLIGSVDQREFQIWRWSSEALVREACRRGLTPLSDDVWALYLTGGPPDDPCKNPPLRK